MIYVPHALLWVVRWEAAAKNITCCAERPCGEIPLWGVQGGTREGRHEGKDTKRGGTEKGRDTARARGAGL